MREKNLFILILIVILYGCSENAPVEPINISNCPDIPTVDYAGKIYNTVLIGEQCWLRENLDVGLMITSNSKNDNQRSNNIIEKFCYDNDTNNCVLFGGLYQWDEIMQYDSVKQGICPNGWHIPTQAEYEILNNTVGKNGNALKTVGKDNVSTNTSGFSALLSGFRSSLDGSFHRISSSTNFWSSTSKGKSGDAYRMTLFNSVAIVSLSSSNKYRGYSVRCLKD